jgi:hydrogenase maturation protease
MQEDLPIRVLGVGNVLTRDDGLGPYVIGVLEAQYDFSDGVEVLDVGTPGLDFTPFLSDALAVIVVDTVRSDAPPGTLRLYRDAEIVASPPPSRMSPHEPGLREALMATELTDSSPREMLLVGVVPETTEAGTRLSRPVADAVPKVVKVVIEELDRLGRPAVPRDLSAEPDIWWE